MKVAAVALATKDVVVIDFSKKFLKVIDKAPQAFYNIYCKLMMCRDGGIGRHATLRG